MSEPVEQATDDENTEKDNDEKSVSEPVEHEEKPMSEPAEQAIQKSVGEPV